MKGVVALLLLGGAVSGATGGCSSSKEQCDCAPSAAAILVPADVAAAVTDVILSGPACEKATLRCEANDHGCTHYEIDATAAGNCQVEVDFATGRSFTAQVTFAASSDSCCAGFYPTPASAGEIDVPQPDGG